MKLVETGTDLSGNAGSQLIVRSTDVNALFEKTALLGPGKTVQIDESKIGKRKYHHGHQVEGQWVFGGMEEDSHKSFMFTVNQRDKDTLLLIIKQWIKPGTFIVSDCWKAY